jgi:hypothetical protein
MASLGAGCYSFFVQWQGFESYSGTVQLKLSRSTATPLMTALTLWQTQFPGIHSSFCSSIFELGISFASVQGQRV